MRVLHFIDNSVRTAGNEIFDYLPVLLCEMEKTADVTILIPRHTSNFKIGGTENVFRYDGTLFMTLADRHRFSRLLNEAKPETVHIHGCGSFTASVFMRLCVRHNIPVVITTGKMFEPWNMRHGYWTHRLVRLITYQYGMIRSACALHALCGQEEKDLYSLRWHNPFSSKKTWNANISVVANFNVTNGMTAADMSEQLQSLYLKVSDSNPFMSMTKDDQRREDLLLAIGTTSETTALPLSDADKLLLSSIDDAAMRRIMLHSNDEGIYKHVIDGAVRCSRIRIPALNVTALERFSSHYLCTDDSRDDDALNYEDIENDELLTDAERDICMKLMHVWRRYRQHNVKRADFAALYSLLRYTDYNEFLLRKALRRLHMEKRSARLLTILAERYGLTDGYMFMPPLDDKVTKRIRRNLSRYGVQ